MHRQIFPEEYYGVIMELATKRRGDLSVRIPGFRGRIVFNTTFLWLN